MGLVTAWVLAFVLERTIGLREPEDVQVKGYDLHYWDTVHDHPTNGGAVAPAET